MPSGIGPWSLSQTSTALGLQTLGSATFTHARGPSSRPLLVLVVTAPTGRRLCGVWPVLKVPSLPPARRSASSRHALLQYTLVGRFTGSPQIAQGWRGFLGGAMASTVRAGLGRIEHLRGPAEGPGLGADVEGEAVEHVAGELGRVAGAELIAATLAAVGGVSGTCH